MSAILGGQDAKQIKGNLDEESVRDKVVLTENKKLPQPIIEAAKDIYSLRYYGARINYNNPEARFQLFGRAAKFVSLKTNKILSPASLAGEASLT